MVRVNEIVMKCTGFCAALLLCLCIIMSGCVQITINAPGFSGPVTPAASPSSQDVMKDDEPEPSVTAVTEKAPAGASGNPLFIVPYGDVSRVGHRTFTFNYAPQSGQQEYTLRIPVNMSVYYGARQMKIDLPASSMNPAEIRQYIDTFESDPAMEELYSGVLSQLRNARYKNGGYLSDDEYFELIVAFVQQIPYVENPSPKRKYPVEVIYDKAGDSDEKSLLLVNLLAREGYDVSLMVFEDLGYETTGIRVVEEVPDSSLKVFSDGKKDYVFVDAGVPRFIGSTPEVFQTADDPGIYPVGSGTKSYRPINYVWKIVADLNHLKKLGKIDKTTVINPWDKFGTCLWIKNSKLLQNTTCYCCDM
ncbi:MAG: hypothetical protein CW742_12455 [Methanoregula sp.]|nr:MAG: hypothetical protein CW742_12455 [Methanoregula sp.]